MDYKIDSKKLKKKLIEQGYPSWISFAKQNQIHRNTLYNFLKGKSVFTSGFRHVAQKLKVNPMEILQPVVRLEEKIEFIQELEPLVAYLESFDPELAIFLIGSRAEKRAQKYSDWDLGLFRYPNFLKGREFLRLKNKIEEQGENLPRFIDCINLNQAPIWFLSELKKTIFLGGNSETKIYFEGVLDGLKKREVA